MIPDIDEQLPCPLCGGVKGGCWQCYHTGFILAIKPPSLSELERRKIRQHKLTMVAFVVVMAIGVVIAISQMV